MSAQFGRCSFDKRLPPSDFVEQVSAMLAPYGPDDHSCYHQDGVSILYRAFHTTKESRQEAQPHIARCGALITWDGRLDNRADLIERSSGSLSVDAADVAIVAAAYDRFGAGCFAKLIGDWALAIWNPNEQALLLAKDPIGTRPLYYSVRESEIAWSSVLEPLMLFAGPDFVLNEEYLAGWFASFPAPHLTPYVGLDAVPPSCFVRLERGRRTTRKYWDFDPAKGIRYRSDAEYEEHFRGIFTEAVQRRLRSETPVLAELSGGMDSSTIVCVADTILARGAGETPRLDTISYYNDAEPNWNERPYFRKVEEKRGRVGCHIDVGAAESFQFAGDQDTFAAMPGSGAKVSDAAQKFAACLTAQGNRVVLSGIGGDEVTGGVPTPLPELMDLIAWARFSRLAHQLKVWALEKKKPWFHLLFEAVRGFLPQALVGVPVQLRPGTWLRPDFVGRHRAALTGYPARVKLCGPLPSFQENLATLDGLRRLVATSVPSAMPQYEKRFPYLDRDLLEFLFAVPREQLIRPGQRRSLMRRALIDIVPGEILHRKRKAFACRAPLVDIAREWPSLVETCRHLESAALGMVDPRALCEWLQEARQGRAIPIVTLLRTFGIESWLRGLRRTERSTDYTFNLPRAPVAERRPRSRAVPTELWQVRPRTRA